jgi:hypothetical protein
MRMSRMVMAGGMAVLGLTALTTLAGAQERSGKRAPSIRVYSRTGDGVGSNYVEPAIDVSENVYVFAVAMDLDGHIQVLHPDFPGISVKIAARKQLQLPNFFAGFSNPNGSYNGYGYASYSASGFESFQTRGTIIALASREPFDLERVESGGDWNIAQIRQLIDRRDPAMAAENLAHFIGVRGVPIGRDFMRFAGGRPGNYAYADSYSACDNFYGSSFALSSARIQALRNVFYLRAAGRQATVVGYDLCGLPIVAYGPVVVSRYPSGHYPHDTTVFPKSRYPHGSGAPRNPGERTAFRPGAVGTFPESRRAEPTQIGDVTVRAPGAKGRRDPREIFEQLRGSSASQAFPESRTPTSSGVPRHEPATLTTQGLHEYRPEPTVNAPSSSGSFPVERTRGGGSGEGYSPPPRVIHESPPPRATPAPVSSPAPAQSSPPPSSPPPARGEATKPPPR